MGIRVFHRPDGSFVVACGNELVVVYPDGYVGDAGEGTPAVPIPVVGTPRRLRPVPGGPGPMAMMVIGDVPGDTPGIEKPHVDLYDLTGKFARQSILGDMLYGQAKGLPTGAPMFIKGTIAAGRHFDVGQVTRHLNRFQSELGRPIVIQVMRQDDET